MAKVCLAVAVKHNGVNHAPNTPFEVSKEEVAGLVKLGAWIVEEPKNVQETPLKETPVEEPKKASKRGGKAKEA